MLEEDAIDVLRERDRLELVNDRLNVSIDQLNLKLSEVNT